MIQGIKLNTKTLFTTLLVTYKALGEIKYGSKNKNCWRSANHFQGLLSEHSQQLDHWKKNVYACLISCFVKINIKTINIHLPPYFDPWLLWIRERNKGGAVWCSPPPSLFRVMWWCMLLGCVQKGLKLFLNYIR